MAVVKKASSHMHTTFHVAVSNGPSINLPIDGFSSISPYIISSLAQVTLERSISEAAELDIQFDTAQAHYLPYLPCILTKKP